ncbi:MAG: peptidase M75 superfamily protein [Bacteroidetes bacterium]|nr:MAG: peptidase M75 superfamily protein [Bacteroidota bacterium]
MQIMNRRMMGRFLSLFLMLSMSFACSNEKSGDSQKQDDFDRSAMLVHWADDYILPAYQNYNQEVIDLNDAANKFSNAPSLNLHANLHAQFVKAYTAWQWVSFLEIGPAEANSLRNFSNIYPTSATEIEQALVNANYNLSLPSTFNEQGFPAIDYLLSGLGDASTTVNQFRNNTDYGRYLSALTERLEAMSSQVLNIWQSSYRNEFISNTGSSATASTNKLINDFIYHFERELRAGKVGIPAGVFSGSPLAQNVEAYYSDSLSQTLFMESLNAHRAFFKGSGFLNGAAGNSLEQYLNYLNIENQGELLSAKISNQMAAAESLAKVLPTSFSSVAANSNQDLLALYDELQKAVVLLKVDMLQALNVRVDYIDADGD